MKILVIGSRVPYPLRDGGAIATYTMLKEFASAGHNVTYFTFNTKKHFVSESDIKLQLPFCRIIPVFLDASLSVFGALKALMAGRNYNLLRFHSTAAEKQLQSLLENESFDVIQFEGLFSMPLFTVANNAAPLTKKVLRAHNVEFKIWNDLANIEKNPVKKWYLKQLCKSLEKEEIAYTKQVDAILAITPDDAAFFQKLIPEKTVLKFPAGIVMPELNNSNKSRKPYTACHLGSMEWMPNREAVDWFSKQVLPEVHLLLPDAEFHIAGKSLKKDDPQFQLPGLINHGEVDSAFDFVSSFSIVVVPLQAGSGLRMKLLEAMFLGMPIVSTSCGAAGLDCVPGQHLLIADSREEWVKSVTFLLQNPEKAAALGAEGAKWVREKYDNQSNCKVVLDFYKKLSDD